MVDFLPFDPTIKRTEGTLRNKKTGAEFKTTKGAPHIILNLLDDSDKVVKEDVETQVAHFGELGEHNFASLQSSLFAKLLICFTF